MRPIIKYAFIFLVCLCMVHTACANAIDSLETKEDVMKFLSSHFGKEYENYSLFFDNNGGAKIDTRLPKRKQDALRAHNEYDRIAHRSNSFYKVDIDNDGETDLVIDAGISMVVFGKGGKYLQLTIESGWSSASYFYKEKITLPDGTPVLLFRHERSGEKWPDDDKVAFITDTLVYKFNKIVEYNSHPPPSYVQKIVFVNHPACFGDCTSYVIEINRNGYAMKEILYGKAGDSSRDLFVQRLDRTTLSEVWGLLAYMDVRSLDSSYSIPASDMATALLSFYFDDGSIKKISDYGFCGTIGLTSLYANIFSLQDSGRWQLWHAAPPAMDTYLVHCPLAFTGKGYESLRYSSTPGDSNLHDVAGRTFVATEEMCTPVKIYITLTADHHFVFRDPAQGKYHVRSFFSIGDWKNIDDSTIVLNWDGLRTLKDARNKEEYKKYFQEEREPYPVRIENWKFINSPGSNLLYQADFKYIIR